MSGLLISTLRSRIADLRIAVNVYREQRDFYLSKGLEAEDTVKALRYEIEGLRTDRHTLEIRRDSLRANGSRQADRIGYLERQVENLNRIRTGLLERNDNQARTIIHQREEIAHERTDKADWSGSWHTLAAASEKMAEEIEFLSKIREAQAITIRKDSVTLRARKVQYDRLATKAIHCALQLIALKLERKDEQA